MNRTNFFQLFLFVLFTTTGCAILTTSQKEVKLANKKILFLGNSITHNGLYVSLIEYALHKSHPNQAFDIISIGLGSETVSCLTEKKHPFPRPCLKERLERALTEIQPDLIFACYGMNDGIYHPLAKTRKEAYQKGIQDLMQKAAAAKAELIILTPPPFDALPIRTKLVDKGAADFGYSQPYRGYDEVLKDYSQWLVKDVGEKIEVIDWHTAINASLQQHRKTIPHFTYAKDGIHPNQAGHLLMAKHLLKSLNKGNSAAFLQDWEKIEKDPFFQKIHSQREERSERWLNYIGYTRGKTVKSISPKKLLILMGGQSNMVGLGKKTEVENPKIPKKIQYLNYGYNAKLIPSSKSFGPEIGVAQELTKTFPYQHFTFLKYAIGGASLLDWAVDYSYEKAKITKNERFGNMYAAFFQKIDSLLLEGAFEPAALLWMQGERDARIPEAGIEYYDNFKSFILAFRQQIENSDLPILIGEVNPPADRYLALDKVRAAHKRLAKELPNVFIIETDDLSKLSDKLHYDTNGQLELGRRFGTRMKRVLEADK